MPTTIPIDKGVKFRCYLICLLAFLLSVSPVNISRVGLFLLLLFAPLMAVYRLHVPRGAAMGWHFLLLLLALSGAVGVVSSGHNLIRLASFLFSLLFWALYLCCRICGQVVPVKTICMIVLEALFSCPAAFFIPNSEDAPEARKIKITKWIYMGYILIGVLVTLVLLLVQANKHISDILLAAGNLVAPRIPLLISCIVLALFPAAVIYSFMLIFPFRRPGHLIQRIGSVIAILLSVLLVLPKGFVLTEVNTSIFLHKYYTHQLSAQMAEAEGTTVEFATDDLRLDLIEYYGIDGIPALARLTGIEDITIQGQTLGTYAKKAILDCLCADLELPRSENDDDDMTAVLRTAAFVSRYRLPSAHLMALQCLKSTS